MRQEKGRKEGRKDRRRDGRKAGRKKERKGHSDIRDAWLFQHAFNWLNTWIWCVCDTKIIKKQYSDVFIFCCIFPNLNEVLTVAHFSGLDVSLPRDSDLNNYGTWSKTDCFHLMGLRISLYDLY